MKNEHINAANSGTFRIGGVLPVHRLGFGAMRLTGPQIWGYPSDQEEAKRVLRRSVELGVNFIDTADSYGPFVSEELIAEALYPYPKDLVIATKGGLVRPGPGRWVPLGRPEYLTQCVEMSLRRLRLDRIDLYQLHAIDPTVPLEDSLGALKKMQEQGKIRFIGISNFSVQEIERARKVVDIVSVQNLYNFSNRQSEDVIKHCEKHQLAFIPWYPVASGEFEQLTQLKKIAESTGASIPQVALAWLLKHSPVMLPIPGTSSIKHLEENIASANIEIKI